MTVEELVSNLTELINANPDRAQQEIYVWLQDNDRYPIQEIDSSIDEHIDINI